MSAPVDVLAVMEEMAGKIWRSNDSDPILALADEARAAVAELIDQVQYLLDSHPEQLTYPDGPCIEERQRAELIAALARCGGAK